MRNNLFMGNMGAGRWPVPKISVVVTALFLAFTAVLVFEGYLLMGQADWLVERAGQATERQSAEYRASELAAVVKRPGQATERQRAEYRASELAAYECSLPEYQQCSVARVDHVAPGLWRSELTVDLSDDETTRFSLCYLIVLGQFQRASLDPAPRRALLQESQLLVTCPPSTSARPRQESAANGR
jgi:hypothetical protein